MHRGGPDDAGIFVDPTLPLALGHRRLSIIDMSAAGHQPMSSDDAMVEIIFNGEIYNFIELREELKKSGYTFKTNSDTEVLIKAYQNWGLECFKQLNGMFALAIYDKSKREVILARDHAGIKPLYIYQDRSSIYFASEIRAFKAASKHFEENPDWKIFLMAFGHLPEPVTTLKNVEPLPKGTYRVINLDNLSYTTATYNKFTFTSSITNLEEAKHALRNSLEAAVKRHLISDAPIGLFLSGGIDSSLLTLLSAPYKKDSLHTLSIVFDDERFSEKYYQDIVIAKTGAKHKSFLVTEDAFREALPDVLQAMDQPSTDGINSYFICKYAKEYGLTAVLSGLGADELLGGYSSFQLASKVRMTRFVPSFVFAAASLSPKDKYKKISYLQRKDGIGEYLFNRGFFSTRDIAYYLDTDYKQVNEVLSSIKTVENTNEMEDGNRTSYLESNLYMQNQLLKDTDYMSMWHAIEVRVPFLDKEFIKTVYSIQNDIKFNHKQGKYLLIEAFRDLLPREIWDRQKQGFTFPFEKWMKGIQPEKPGNKFSVAFNRFKKGELQWSRYWAFVLTHHTLNINETLIRPKKLLFLNLTAFSQTGGIEKFNRGFLKALNELESENIVISDSFSAYDTSENTLYYPTEKYKGFNKHRLKFVVSSVWNARHYDIIVLGHINMAVAGFLIKLIYPFKKLLVITHGIEVWSDLPFVKKSVLHNSNMILAVSNFTKSNLIAKHRIKQNKITIFYNTIDPYFEKPEDFSKPDYLGLRYGIRKSDYVLYTLTRLSSAEKYKGYDLVIQSLPEIKKSISNVKYILAGKADDKEFERITNMVKELDLQNEIILAGFLPDTELIDHYRLADLFIMPSQKEGFGIVFIEAMACGLEVIAGNKDGSVDALQGGKLGTLIDPENRNILIETVISKYNNLRQGSKEEKEKIQSQVIGTFGFERYKSRLKGILTEN